MEPKTQYALYESESTPQIWAASVRVTPELLDKLQQRPEQVLLRLNVSSGADGVASSVGSGGVSAARGKSKKTSVLSVKSAAAHSDDGEASTEQYEMLSFGEDPRINHLCAFRRAANAEGFHIHKAGAIHQKLLVQRLLDATEKGRIKDKHARSVLASKSRASKLIDAELQAPAKRPRIVRTRLSSAKTVTRPAGASAWAVAAGHKRKLRLPSALTQEEAQETRARIAKGVEQELSPEQTQEAAAEKAVAPEEEVGDAGEAPEDGVVVPASARASFHELFSSDSDDAPREAAAAKEEPPQQQKPLRKKAAKETLASRVGPKKAYKSLRAPGDEAASSLLAPEMVAQPKVPAVHVASAPHAANTEARAIAATPAPLKPVKPSAEDGDVKRARVRSTLLPEGARPSLLPDLSFLPPVVREICKRLAARRTRSVVLDESDYDDFVEQYEQLRRDWELLDKAHAIATIEAEGLHLQLELATEETRLPLETRLQTWATRKEGLGFVRTAMATINSLLEGLQNSIDHFDRKECVRVSDT